MCSFRFEALKFFDSFAQNLLTFLCSSSGKGFSFIFDPIGFAIFDEVIFNNGTLV
jgi:hypothetical protein